MDLEAGAKEIVTLEYGEIISKHPKIKTMTPLQFRKSYLSDTYIHFFFFFNRNETNKNIQICVIANWSSRFARKI